MFDTADTLRDTLTIFVDMVDGITVNAENMRCFIRLQRQLTWQTGLVKRGLPFRDAHEVVALAVRQCEELGCDLAELSLEQLQGFDARLEEDVFDVLTLECPLMRATTSAAFAARAC